MSPLVSVRNLKFGYGERLVLSDINLEVLAGERVGLIGASGAGKSTLLQLLVGLCRSSEGEIQLLGKTCSKESEFQSVRPHIGLLFQDSDDQLFCPTVLEDVAFGPRNQGLSVAQAKKRAMETLEQLGIADLADRCPWQLSGGQKKLTALATVLSMRPKLLLLDEPSSNLDVESCARLRKLLFELQPPMLISSHDSRFLEGLVDRQLCLDKGRLRPVCDPCWRIASGQ